MGGYATLLLLRDIGPARRKCPAARNTLPFILFDTRVLVILLLYTDVAAHLPPPRVVAIIFVLWKITRCRRHATLPMPLPKILLFFRCLSAGVAFAAAAP